VSGRNLGGKALRRKKNTKRERERSCGEGTEGKNGSKKAAQFEGWGVSG